MLRFNLRNSFMLLRNLFLFGSSQDKLEDGKDWELGSLRLVCLCDLFFMIFNHLRSHSRKRAAFRAVVWIAQK